MNIIEKRVALEMTAVIWERWVKEVVVKRNKYELSPSSIIIAKRAVINLLIKEKHPLFQDELVGYLKKSLMYILLYSFHACPICMECGNNCKDCLMLVRWKGKSKYDHRMDHISCEVNPKSPYHIILDTIGWYSPGLPDGFSDRNNWTLLKRNGNKIARYCRKLIKEMDAKGE